MSTTEATPQRGLFAKLAEIMEEVGRVPKNGRNDFHKYDYVTEADLVEAVRSKLAARHVVLIPSAGEVSQQGTVTTVHMRFTFVDGETGEQFEADWFGAGEDKGDKGIYKAYTGALKYFLMKSFLIATGDDPERDTDNRAAAGNGAAQVRAITAKRAKELAVGAFQVGVGDKLQLAASHAHGGNDVGDCSTEEAAAEALKKLTAEEADKVELWLHRKADEKATADA